MCLCSEKAALINVAVIPHANLKLGAPFVEWEEISS